MSLFPAYSDDKSTAAGIVGSTATEEDAGEEPNSLDWLTNSSYATSKISSEILYSESSSTLKPVSSPVHNDVVPVHASHEKEKGKKKKEKGEKRGKTLKAEAKVKAKNIPKKGEIMQHAELDTKGVYFEDKHREHGNNKINELCTRARPLYNLSVRSLGFTSHKSAKKKMYRRYFSKNLAILNESKEREICTVAKGDMADDTHKNKEVTSTPTIGTNDQLERSRNKEYNEQLLQKPNDVELWIEYIDFQDGLVSMDRYRSAEDVRRVTLLKKLSIVEKALDKNPESGDLLKLKLSFMGELLPADHLSAELEGMLSKDAESKLLWQIYIMTTQTSVAICTVPKVLELYTKCFTTLKQQARTNPGIYDRRLLEMLHQCATFLRQTGLWEQMWETLWLNLKLNLILNSNDVLVKKGMDEKSLIGMEEMILLSQLPLNQLWQRIESLRENCHWVSVSREELELVGDARRFILPEDVADFVHPVLSPESNFRMAVYCLIALKVPLLPTRDSTLKELGIEAFGWGIESSEALLPLLYSTIGEISCYQQRKELVSDILAAGITSGPQYILYHPAQESYLEFIREIFHILAENLSSTQRTSIYTWWLRFERLIISIHRDDPLTYDAKRKKLKAILKEFFKREENRNNLHFYREYALIEREMGRLESCVNILQTAIHSSGGHLSRVALAVSGEENHCAAAPLLSLYRTLLETLLGSDSHNKENRQQIIRVFEGMLPAVQNFDRLLLVENYFEDYVKTFRQSPPPVEDSPEDGRRAAFFLPNDESDALACYAYLLYIKDLKIDEPIKLLDSCINQCKGESSLREYLYEAKLTLAQLHYERTKEMDILRKAVNEILSSYGNNFLALSIYAYLESESPIWKFNTRSRKIALWKAIALCLACRRRIRCMKQVHDSDGVRAALNKLLSFHQVLARAPATKSCPLLWRLYMLLLREHNLCEKKGEEIYHETVEHCPWVRSVYIDAADIAPQLLTQIQDVMREKELRMHVTPEELDILRN